MHTSTPLTTQQLYPHPLHPSPTCHGDAPSYNHITAAVPRADGDDARPSGRFLINPFGLRFCEVTASSLVTVDLEGTVQEAGSSGRPVNRAGFVIHSAVHAARHDLRCIFHNHTDPCTAVATQRRGLLPLSQEACIIWPKVSRAMHGSFDVTFGPFLAHFSAPHRPTRAVFYALRGTRADRVLIGACHPTLWPIWGFRHPFEGVATDLSERGRLLEALGPAPSAVLFLRNHGVLVGGGSVGGAFWNTYVVWRACQLQCAAMASVGGRLDELVMPPQDVVEGTGKRVQAGLDAAGATWGSLEFEAVLRQMREEQPDFEQ